MSAKQALAILAIICTSAAIGFVNDATPRAHASIVVRARQSGVTFNTKALSGRVALVASSADVRWRIAGVTGWRYSHGRLLTPSWDTTRVKDGRYALELEEAGGETTQPLFVINHTYVDPDLEGTAWSGLQQKTNDAGSVVAVFTRRSYRPATPPSFGSGIATGPSTSKCSSAGPRSS